MLLIVGLKEIIDMNRTQIDVYDYIFNQIYYISNCMHRLTAGSMKEGFEKSSDIDFFHYLKDHNVLWDFTDSENYDKTTTTIILMEYQEDIPGTVYLRLINMHPSNKAITKFSCIKRNSLTYISSKLFLANAESYCHQKVFQHGPCYYHTFDGETYEYALGLVCRKWPLQTNEWMERCHKSGWPEKQILEKMCYLVAF